MCKVTNQSIMSPNEDEENCHFLAIPQHWKQNQWWTWRILLSATTDWEIFFIPFINIISKQRDSVCYKDTAESFEREREREREMAGSYWYKDVLPFSAMVAVECTNVGLNTLFKAATLKGLSYYVFILYSYAIATLLLLPLAFIFRRYVSYNLLFYIIETYFSLWSIEILT